MAINVIDALTQIKNDKNWVKKIAIASSIMLLGVIAYAIAVLLLSKDMYIASIVFSVVTLIICLYVGGFVISTAHRTLNNEDFKLAELNEKNLMLKGLHYSLSIIGYGILVFAIIFLMVLILSFSIGLIYGLVGETVGNILTSIIGIIGIILYIPFILYLFILILIAFACYLKNLKFTDIIALPKHFAILKNHHKACWAMFGHQFLYAILFGVIVSILPITIVGILLIPFAYLTAYIWCNNILAQFAKEIEIEKYLEKK